MRTYIKKQLWDLLDSIEQMQSLLTNITDQVQIITMLADCQQAAITIGETLERDSSDHGEIISLLEEYCEEAFLISQSQQVSEEKKVSVLSNLTDRIKPYLEDILENYQIVFLPYKASMWDSLESIWIEAQKDKRCECYVIPIPYYEFDAKINRWVEHFDGSEFPEYVPVVAYQKYSLEQNRPDIAYIHNPYDDWNFVTRVNKRFISGELKKYVNKLVYVPYYVTGGFIAKDHLGFPVYKNMDYMVVQSEYAKSFCEGMYYYDKILPLGSPKLDRVINLCRNGSVIPAQWQLMLEGKKVLMLNTSIGCFLQDGEIYLQKIKRICQIIKQQNQVALIWRPHPLLEATIRSMRPHLMESYCSLRAYFIENNIGVLDETSDISRAIAISDGYIGEESSSVVNMYGAAGKPIFILNNYITDNYSEEEQYRVHITDIFKQKDKVWITTNRLNSIFYMDVNTKIVHFVDHVDKQPKWNSTYPFFAEVDDKLFLSPALARCPAVFDLTTRKQELIGKKDSDTIAGFNQIVAWGGRVFYLPSVGGSIAEFHIKTGRWKYHTECMEALWKDVGKEAAEKQSITYRCSTCEKDIWISAVYTNCILRFHMEDGTYALCQVGEKGNGYSGIIAEERCIWLAEVHSGNLVRWDRRSGKVRTFIMPEGFRSRPGKIYGGNLPHMHLIDMGKWIVTVPGFSNCMVKLDKTTGKTSLLLKDFWKESEEAANGYNPDWFLSSEFGVKWDENKLIVQRSCDEAAAIIHVEDESWEIFYPTLTKADYGKMLEGEDGFEKIEKKSGFFRIESKFFSFENFLAELIQDRLKEVRVRQLEELSTLASNLDGTCGMKVHQYMMKVMETKE